MYEYVMAPEQDVVISSRVRLSRNYEDLPFSPKLSQEYAEEVIERTADAVFNTENGAAFTFLRMSDLEEDARSRLVEHHLISYDLLKYVNWSGAMISSAGTVTVMLNEEDHIRIQGLLPGIFQIGGQLFTVQVAFGQHQVALGQVLVPNATPHPERQGQKGFGPVVRKALRPKVKQIEDHFHFRMALFVAGCRCAKAVGRKLYID